MKNIVGLVLVILCVGNFSSLGQGVSDVTVSGLFFVDKEVNGSFIEDLTGLTAPFTYTYEWMSAPSSGGTATAIPGAPNSMDYVIESAVLGRRLQLKVTITDDGGTEISGESGLSPVIEANTTPYATGTATISQFPPNLNVGTTLLGDYSYSDDESDPEGTSLFKWLRSDFQAGPYSTTVSTDLAYTLQSSDQGKWFIFEVTPVAINGESPGTPDTSSEIGPVNTAPSVSNVSIFGILSAGNEVKARYDYSDTDGDADISLFQWYLNNIPIGGAIDSAYTILGEDEGSILKVIVTPKSETGYPDTGTPVSASVSLGHSSLPQALNVCISGKRRVGEILTGHWDYSYVDASGDQISEQRNSITEWFIDDNLVKTSLDSDNADSSPTLTSVDLNKKIEFRVTPVSRSNAQGSPEPSAPMAIFSMPRTEYSMDNIDVELIAIPTGGEFACFDTITAVSGNYFHPGSLEIGDYSIRYSVDITVGDKTYNQKAWITLSVTEATSFFDSFDDHYCKGLGTLDTIYVRNTTLEGPKIFWQFSLTDNDAFVSNPNDTTIVIRIDSLLSGNKIDYMTYTYYSILGSHTIPAQGFVIDSVGNDLSIINLDPFYCQEQDTAVITIINMYPYGGTGDWTGDVITNEEDLKSTLDPSHVITTGKNYIDYTYTSPLGCSRTVRDSVIINPTPGAAFIIDDRCIDFEGDTTSFTNNTPDPDSVEFWNWNFGPSEGTSNEKEPKHVYETGGTKEITLIATTFAGCIDTLSVTDTLARKPESDFRWEDDCYHEGENLLLLDNASFTESVDTAYWVIDWIDRIDVNVTDPNTQYLKTAPGIINVEYYLKTFLEGCYDVATHDIYIRPVNTISEVDYYENFQTGELGWFHDIPSDTTWTKGVPQRFGVDLLSADTSWYTNYNMLTQLASDFAVESPCFDFRNVERPMISMDIMRRFDRGRDGAVLQYRVGNSPSWDNVGGTFYGINWYQNSNIFGRPGESVVGWSPDDEDNTWVEARQYLDELIGLYDVKFRFAYGSAGPSEGNVENEGFAFDNIWIGERKRNVLVEHFTNSEETDSPAADAIVNDIVAGSPKDALNIQYHTNYLPGDPFYIENTADPSSRVLYYGLSEVPYTLYDGGFNYPGSWARKYDFEPGNEADINDLRNRSLIDPLFLISVDSVSPANYQVNIEALEDNIDAEDITLFIAAVADTATSAVIDNGQTEFMNVLIKMYPDGGGHAMLTLWDSSDTDSFSFSLGNILPNNYDIDTIRVIAFLQNNITKEVFQSAVSEPLKATVTSIGRVRFDEANFKIFPNPASTNLTFLFDNEVYGDSELKFYNNTGVVIRELTLAPGIKSITIEELALPSGIYLVKLIIDGKPSGFRKLIIANR